MDWSSYDMNITNEILEKIEDYDKKNNGEQEERTYEELPYGDYKVVVEDIYMGITKDYAIPMMTVKFRILNDDENKYRLMWANFVMGSEFPIYMASKFITTMLPEGKASFSSFSQWEVYLAGINELLSGKAAYTLKYSSRKGKNGKTYPSYEITEGPYQPPEDYEYRPPVSEE